MLDAFLQYDIFPFLVVLTALVFFHELGHYLVARWNGVKIETFSIGFGPEIFGWHDKHGTRWKFSIIPLGGYVKMHGDTNVASAPIGVSQDVSEEEKKISFSHKSLGQRAAIVAAGPAANFLLAIVIMAITFAFIGQTYAPAIADQMNEDGAAATAGLEIGDEILAINGRTIRSFNDVQRIVRLSPDENLIFRIKRNEDIFEMPVRTDVSELKDNFGGTHRIGLIGISSTSLGVRELSAGAAIKAAVHDTYNIAADTLKALWQIISGTRSIKELGGPVKIAQLSGDMARANTIAFVMFIALLSVNLGLINLFPIPALDGGHLLYYAAEAIRGKPLSERVQEYGALAGIGAVGLLIVVITWNDIARLVM